MSTVMSKSVVAVHMTIKKSVIKKHPDKADCQGVFLVISERFERSTHSLEELLFRFCRFLHFFADGCL